jgi:uncharacterized protein
MKYLLVIALVFVVYFIWRSGRRNKIRPPKAGVAPPGAPQDMVRCPVCSVHLPVNDAVTGRLALYCSAQHRDQAED